MSDSWDNIVEAKEGNKLDFLSGPHYANEPPPGATGYHVWISNTWPHTGARHWFVEFRYYCEHCDEDMRLAWSRSGQCPICGERMTKYDPSQPVMRLA